MQPNSNPRRVHDAQFKARVMAECQQPGVSVSAVALAHGLNANLVRKWLVGRGLKRSGLTAPRQIDRRRVEDEPPREVRAPALAQQAPGLQFVPLQLSPVVDEAVAAGVANTCGGAVFGPDIQIELNRGASRLTVRWPSSQAVECANWLHAVAALLK